MPEDGESVYFWAWPSDYKIVKRGKDQYRVGSSVDVSLDKQRDANLRSLFGY